MSILIFDFNYSIAQTMSTINKLNDPTKMAQTMKEFEKQNMQMAMTDEMSMCLFVICNYTNKAGSILFFF